MRDQGFEVAECRTSGEALRAVAEFLPEAVLIITGENKSEAYELSARLRSGASTMLLPVLHVVPPGRAAIVRSLEYADVCIPEPVDPPVLAAAIESLVRRFRMAEQFAGRAGRLYRAIVQHLPDAAVYVVDRELRCVIAEGRALETLGLSRRALEGKPVTDFDTSGAGESLARTLTEVLAGKSVCVEAPYRGRMFLAQLVPLRNEHSEIIAAMVVATDITERKRTESALRESEDRYRRLFESSPIGVASARARPDGLRIIAANDAWLAMTGYSREDLQGEGIDCRRLSLPEYLPFCSTAFAEARATGRSSIFEKECVTKDGRRLPVILGFATMGCKADELVSFAIDITERKRTESALRESEDRYRRLYESSPIGMISLRLNPDNTARVTAANDAWLAMTGYSRADIEAEVLDCQRLTPPEYASASEAALAEARATGRSAVFEKEHIRKDGTRAPVLSGYAALGPATDEVVAFAIDITERKRLEDRLHEAQKTESIGVLAGGVAHDFNNLLTTILGNASLLAEMLPARSPEMNRVRQIIRSSEHAADLTRQLLAYAGKGSFVTTELDISQAVRDLTPLLRASLPATVSLELDLDDGLPVVRADRGQLHQIVMNLVLNASEACGDRPSVIGIRTASRDVPGELARSKGPNVRAGSHVMVEVADDGDGIDPAILPRIFEPFFTTKFAGRGLGLAAVQGIVRRHGGFLEVESHPGMGASFRVLLPVAEGQAAAAEATDSVHD